jgi:GDP-L-fucose synthase
MIGKDSKIFVAGHKGLAGSAIWRALSANGYNNLVSRTRNELDLLNTAAVAQFYASEHPQYVIIAAAKVGGIMANSTQPADFLFQNLQIQNNLIDGAYRAAVKKLLFLGSSCIYPKHAPQPMKEEALLTGPLEPTNEWYAVAKIAGIKMCEAYRKQYGCNFISAMPTNLYGPGDNYDLNNSHVLPALIRKFHEAKVSNSPTVSCWGSGSPLREFLYSDDLGEACVFLMRNYNESQFINVGSGTEITIRQLTELVKAAVGYEGQVVWDSSKPDGSPRKLMDNSRINKLGWNPRITLQEGIPLAYVDFVTKETSSLCAL